MTEATGSKYMWRGRNGAKGEVHVLELGVCAHVMTNENDSLNQ